jgi:hypothetical protein
MRKTCLTKDWDIIADKKEELQKHMRMLESSYDDLEPDVRPKRMSEAPKRYIPEDDDGPVSVKDQNGRAVHKVCIK